MVLEKAQYSLVLYDSCFNLVPISAQRINKIRVFQKNTFNHQKHIFRDEKDYF